MDKKETLTQLRSAKSAHIQWRSYAQALIAGIPVNEEYVPIIHTNCKFGKWYYGSGQKLSSLSAFKTIETPHEVLHQVYIEIFKLLFGKDERSALKKIFGSSAKIKQENQEKAEALMQKLLAISATLLEAITLLEEEIKQIPDEEFSTIY